MYIHKEDRETERKRKREREREESGEEIHIRTRKEDRGGEIGEETE